MCGNSVTKKASKDATEKSQELPELKENDEIKIIHTSSEEKYTNPPNRYSSTSLINKLEELGIGRPSTYVSIIESITSVFINSDSSLKPRILAIALINNFMKPYFNNYIDYEFSKSMEDELDKILESDSPEKSKIDFLIGDVVNKIGNLSPEITAANFGKAVNSEFATMENVAASLCNMIGEVIGTIAYLNAFLLGVDKVYFIGRTALLKNVQAGIGERLQLAGIKGIYAENCEYANALGCIEN